MLELVWALPLLCCKRCFETLGEVCQEKHKVALHNDMFCCRKWWACLSMRPSVECLVSHFRGFVQGAKAFFHVNILLLWKLDVDATETVRRAALRAHKYYWPPEPKSCWGEFHDKLVTSGVGLMMSLSWDPHPPRFGPDQPESFPGAGVLL